MAAKKNIAARLMGQLVASCSCMTKTNLPEYHKEDCLYRVLLDAIDIIQEQRLVIRNLNKGKKK